MATNAAARGRVWGILMIGGAGKADIRGLSIHDTVRHHGYARWFEMATEAAARFKGGYDIGGFVIDRPFGNFGDQMMIDDRDRLLPLVETREPVERAISYGIGAFFESTGVMPWIYLGSLKSAYWQSLTSDQLRERLMEYVGPFAGCPIAIDDRDQDTAMRAAEILEMEGHETGYEPLDRADGNWWATVRRAFVRSVHLEQIERGETYEVVDGEKRYIQWAAIDMMNGPRTILMKQKVEPTLAAVRDRLAAGWDVAVGCLKGSWRPGDGKKGLTAAEIDGAEAVL